MRILKKYWAVLMLTYLALSLAGTEKTMAQGGAGVSFQTFYDELSPYGRWINYPGHGYVWAPNVEAGFQPYATRGHWVITEYGNTWVSDYAWGWAPFHYGRWLWDDFMGWVWVPGTEWGPAWVNWRSGADYYGWAPLGPGMHVNLVVNIPVAHWVFVPRRHIMSRRIYNYCIPRTTVVNVYHNTTIINNYYRNDNRTYVYGPRVQEIEQHSRSRVPVYRVNQDSRPGRAVVDKGSVRMYRPDVTAQRNEAPARVVSRENYTRSERAGSESSNYQERADRSSYSGNRNSPARAGNGAGSDNPARENSSDIRRNTAREATVEGRGNRPGENTTESRSNATRENYPGRESYAEGRDIPARDNNTGTGAGTPAAGYTRTREATRSRATATERATESSAPTQERTVRERPVRVQPPAGRSAATETPVTRELPQPARTQYNPVVRQEQPAVRTEQRDRQQSSQPQYQQPDRQSQPQRPSRSQMQPQRQEPSGGVTERQPRN